MTKIPTDDVPESLYNLRVRESDQLKTVLELYDMGDSSKIEDHGGKKYRSETQIEKL